MAYGTRRFNAPYKRISNIPWPCDENDNNNNNNNKGLC